MPLTYLQHTWHMVVLYEFQYVLTQYKLELKLSRQMTVSIHRKLIALIGDEDTCTGFLLGGTGELNAAKQANFFTVTKDTTTKDIEDKFKLFTSRNDVAILLITQSIAEEIRYLLDSHMECIPAILEIPSKDHPYDPSKDSILKRARGMFNAEDFR